MARVRPVRSVVAAVFTAGLIAGGCGEGNQADSTPSPPANSGTTTVGAPIELPDSSVGRQARWVLDQLASEDGPSADEARQRFSAAFLDEIAPAEVAGVFAELRPAGPWTPVDLDAVGSDAVVRLHDGTGRPWRMLISVDADDAIGTLYIQPDNDNPEAPASSWAEIHERLTELDAGVSMLAARVTDDEHCEPIAEIDSGQPRPMASIFKLYVLGALADAVGQGRVEWGDEVTITDDTRSLPSGELQDRPNGTRVSVSQAAAGMIAISDNTAADLIAELVGREAVEAAMTTMGHAQPELNIPFLTTREFFTIGWGPDLLADDWRAADTGERQRIVDGLPSGALEVEGQDVTDVVWDSGVDWFGSARDICAALVSLHDDAPDDPDTRMLRTILGHNRGATIDRTVWPYVAYKGGSAPGVLTASWYGERRDGERYVFVMQAAADDPAALEDRSSFFAQGQSAFALFARS